MSPTLPPSAPSDALTTYSAGHRRVELAAIVGFFCLTLVVFWRVARHAPQWSTQSWMVVGAALVTGWIGADVVSGLVHWAFDTWGRLDTPVLGSSFIRPFRDHHVDPLGITRHDFVETNGNNCLATLPVLGWAAQLDPADGDGSLWIAAFLLTLSLGVFATNQFHKWAHDTHAPGWVRWLQDRHVILPHDHHAIHHRAPYVSQYCITTGWMNAPLNALGFFRRLEAIIHWATGVEPRTEDGRLTGLS